MSLKLKFFLALGLLGSIIYLCIFAGMVLLLFNIAALE